MILPVAPVVMPADMAGVPNGAVPPALLTRCGLGDFLMHHLASRAMIAMAPAVKGELGITLWATSTLRSIASQTTAFDGTNPRLWSDPYSGRFVPEHSWAAYQATGRKWAVKSNGQNDVRTWNSTRWKRRNGTAGAAVPGTSNHGRAIAVDLAENAGGTVKSVSSRLVTWLVANAHQYGYSAEDQSEAWHWRYVAGDDVPPAVLAFEAGQGLEPQPPKPDPAPVPPPPPPGGLVVWILNVPGTFAQFIGIGTDAGVVESAWWCRDTKVRDNHLAAGAQPKSVSYDDMRNIFLTSALPTGDTVTWTAANFAGVR